MGKYGIESFDDNLSLLFPLSVFSCPISHKMLEKSVETEKKFSLTDFLQENECSLKNVSFE